MLAAALAVVALAGATLVSDGHKQATPAYTLVQLIPAAACTEAAGLVRSGARAVAAELRLYRLSTPSAARVAPVLRARGTAQTITADRSVGSLSTMQNEDPLLPEEWWRSAVGIDGLTPPGPGKPITVVDSGVDVTHPEFAGRPNLTLLNAQEPAGFGGDHGTQVASLVGAPVNGAGIVGIYPEAVLRSWDAAIGEGTRLETSDIVAGIMAAARGGPGVINLSLGGPRDSLIEQAVGEAWAAGVLIVAASGNDGNAGSPLTYPASLPHVLTVGASDESNTVASFSSTSRFVDLVAPGQQMVAASARSHSWGPSSGTSFAAPLVAGGAAWVWTARPDLDNAQMFEVMRRAARDVGAPGRDTASGFGILDIGRALSWPVPARDPLEPNEDIEHVKPGGFFATGLPPLTARGKDRATVVARLDYAEDPRDVYRVWVPARRSVGVTLRSTVDVELSVYGPDAANIDNEPRAERLGISARSGSGSERIVVKPAQRGRWAYVVVTTGRRVQEASYNLSVTPIAAARS
jgi:subtilisin family serine protease